MSLWAVLTAFAWFSPARPFSDAERRPLSQMPEISADSLLDGSFMADFEDYSLDQFPLRDGFRTLKSLFHSYGLSQSDNNGIYLANGSAAKQEYPLNTDSVRHALERFDRLYDKYLTDSEVFMVIVPDKGYYLAEKGGNLSLDYGKLFSMVEEGMPWATHIDITGALSADDYYRTDTHWRQENLLDAAAEICGSMGVTAPKWEDYRANWLDVPFYGVYYGQAALPMEPDKICVLENGMLANCTVFDHETGKTNTIYDMEKLTGKDPYDVYLSGARALLTIENPNAASTKELLVFRDSFGSSMIPLLIADYAKVTVVDIRYIQTDMLDRFIDFSGQDTLFLYSTLVLNNSTTLK